MSVITHWQIPIAPLVKLLRCRGLGKLWFSGGGLWNAGYVRRRCYAFAAKASTLRLFAEFPRQALLSQLRLAVCGTSRIGRAANF